MTALRVISYGCDPEIFVRNKAGDVCSAIGQFGGTKQAPKPIKVLGKGFAVQEDNVLVEFNIPPAKDGAEFISHVQRTVDLLAKRAARKGLSFTQGSAFSLKPEYLQDQAALVFGCEPDFNAYTAQANPAPRAEDKNLRSAGGHIAFGLEWESSPGWFENYHNAPTSSTYQRMVVQKLDYLLGIPSILLDDGQLRKQLYGKAGAFRPKEFGVEYRTLSNFWIFKPEMTKAMLDVVAQVDFFNWHPSIASDVIETGINTNNIEFANWALAKDKKHFGWVRDFL